jgi:hypothetical protein
LSLTLLAACCAVSDGRRGASGRTYNNGNSVRHIANVKLQMCARARIRSISQLSMIKSTDSAVEVRKANAEFN